MKVELVAALVVAQATLVALPAKLAKHALRANMLRLAGGAACHASQAGLPQAAVNCVFTVFQATSVVSKAPLANRVSQVDIPLLLGALIVRAVDQASMP